MKYFLLSLFLFPLSPAIAQENDSIPQATLDSVVVPEKGSYKINDQLTYIYQKPRFVDIFNKIPHNIGKSAVEMVSKPNYPYGLRLLVLLRHLFLLTLGSLEKVEVWVRI